MFVGKVRGLGLLAVVATLMLAGCVSPDGLGPTGTAPEEPSRPGAPPPPEATGAQPLLLPGSPLRAEPWGYVRTDWTEPAGPSPVIFMIDGYMGASAPHPTHYLRMRDGVYVALAVIADHPLLPPGYVLAWASIRGTGCSGGTFDLFDRTHAFDGHDLIEWIAAQPWSTGKVGLFGASYSGITAFLVASTQPPSLVAMSANMVIDDLYRGIAYPGGVPNTMFPVLWTVFLRPVADTLGTAGGVQAQDDVCVHNVATRRPGNPVDNPTLGMYTRTLDDPMYQVRSLVTFAELIKVPTYISHAWQDEQTGPRGGAAMFNAIHPDPVLVDGQWIEPKKLTATNGVHYTAASVALSEAQRWFDHWLLGIDTGMLREPPVKLLFNTVTGDEFAFERDAEVALDAFPASSTRWARHYFRHGGALSEEPPAADEAPAQYVTGSPRQSWHFEEPTLGGEATMAAGPDVLTYLTEPFAAPALLAGPMAATLFVGTTAPETDLFVSVADVAPDGAATFLARGMLRASHRSLDAARSTYNAAGELIIPWHPHTNPQPPEANEVERYEVEVFPLAHVVHPGHRLQVRVHTPPLADGEWGYNPARVPGLNTVHQDADRPSSILLPFVPWPEGVPLPRDAPCGEPDGYRCVVPLAAVEPAASGEAPQAPGSLPTLLHKKR